MNSITEEKANRTSTFRFKIITSR